MHVGRYELFEEVGRGAGGVVHRALDPTLGRTVAIKLLHAGSDPVALGRFGREARVAAGVRHPGLVTVLDAGQLADGRPWIAMEWVEGEPLRDRLKREGRVPPREAARLVAAVAGGLAQVHAAGLVHRDVKAENILVGTDGAPRLSDFGVVGLRAGAEGAAARLTRTGELVGTPAAMAPEQAAGEGRVGPEADVWALGVLLHELLTGRPPFARASVMATLEAVMSARSRRSARTSTRGWAPSCCGCSSATRPAAAPPPSTPPRWPRSRPPGRGPRRPSAGQAGGWSRA